MVNSQRAAPAGRIVAPVTSAEEVRSVCAAGADEIYCGALFDSWVERWGEGDLANRRQGRWANVRGVDELAAVAAAARACGCKAALALNARYTEGQARAVLELAHLWEDAGGAAVIVADPGMMVALGRSGSRLERHVSLMANTSNSCAAAFFAGLGARRIILPRELSVPAMRALAGALTVPVELEAIVLHQKCPLQDGTCGFQHSVHLPAGVPVDVPACPEADAVPVLWADDPAYEGHGCQRAWRTERGPVRLERDEDASSPACAACQLQDLAAAGVRCWKIAGRGFPGEIIERSVRFLRQAAVVEDGAAALVRESYLKAFGTSCGGERCYYRRGRA